MDRGGTTGRDFILKEGRGCEKNHDDSELSRLWDKIEDQSQKGKIQRPIIGPM